MAKVVLDSDSVRANNRDPRAPRLRVSPHRATLSSVLLDGGILTRGILEVGILTLGILDVGAQVVEPGRSTVILGDTAALIRGSDLN
jgi:hypothetical protein